MTAGVDARTGLPLQGWPHVQQSLGVIFTTRIGQRLMRRTFGSFVPGLLGKPLTPGELARFYMAIVIGVALWEPRFRVTSVAYPGAQNSASGLGQGRFGVKITGQYMPNALEGDFTVAATATVTL